MAAEIAAYYGFRWWVPPDGFQWVDGRPTAATGGETGKPRPKTEPVLVPVPVPRTLKARDYRPLAEYTGLFLTFAELAPTQEAILKFANQYGSLHHFDVTERLKGPKLPNGHPPTVPIRWPDERTSEIGAVWFSTWEREIGTLSAAVKLWRTEQQGLTLGPPEHIDPDEPARLFAELGIGSLKDLIKHHLRNRLAGHIAPEFTGDAVELIPTTLLGALWLQFTLAVAGKKEFRRCPAPGCPRGWFEVSAAPFGLRPEAKYCSAACRNRDWYEKEYEPAVRDELLHQMQQRVAKRAAERQTRTGRKPRKEKRA